MRANPQKHVGYFGLKFGSCMERVVERESTRGTTRPVKNNSQLGGTVMFSQNAVRKVVGRSCLMRAQLGCDQVDRYHVTKIQIFINEIFIPAFEKSVRRETFAHP